MCAGAQVVALLVMPALVAQLRAGCKRATSSVDLAAVRKRVTSACQMLDDLSNEDLSSLNRSYMLEVTLCCQPHACLLLL